MGETLIKAGESKDMDLIVTCNILLDFTRLFNSLPTTFIPAGEDSFVHKYISPFLNNIFMTSVFNIKW